MPPPRLITDSMGGNVALDFPIEEIRVDVTPPGPPADGDYIIRLAWRPEYGDRVEVRPILPAGKPFMFDPAESALDLHALMEKRIG